MRRVITLVSCFLLLSFSKVSAQEPLRFGIKGGVNMTTTKVSEIADINKTSSFVGFNLGVAANLDLPLGLALQPELIYSRTGLDFSLANLSGNNTNYDALIQNNFELPVNVQWGIRLGPIRPFVQASPYLSYTISSKAKTSSSVTKLDVDRFQYGMGVGFGIDVWKLQLTYRYKWALGTMGDGATFSDFIDLNVSDKIKGSEIGLVIFF